MKPFVAMMLIIIGSFTALPVLIIIQLLASLPGLFILSLERLCLTTK